MYKCTIYQTPVTTRIQPDRAASDFEQAGVKLQRNERKPGRPLTARRSQSAHFLINVVNENDFKILKCKKVYIENTWMETRRFSTSDILVLKIFSVLVTVRVFHAIILVFISYFSSYVLFCFGISRPLKLIDHFSFSFHISY